MKMMYEVPEMEVVLFAVEDVIATSDELGNVEPSSGLNNGGVGDGGSTNLRDLFPNLGQNP